MRTQALSAILIPTILLGVMGCAQKEDEATKEVQKTTSPKSTTPKAPSKANAPAARPQAAAPTANTGSKAGEPVVAPTPETTVYLGQVLATWKAGKQGEAVNQFLQLNWHDPSVLQGIPALSMSEQDFASLSPAQRDRMSQQVQTLAQNLREIAKAVVASTDSFMASGNTVGAKARLDSVQQFGQGLATPERLQIIQLVGKAITALAQEKLSAIK
ncbi:MAG: hypothetical protein JW955_13690 [Sedimentisphaerales bacterium]|nr:hypothetical protein [Sedimentisphaerales bacterium]